MQVHILDDWHDTLRTLPSFARLAAHEVRVWNDRVEDPAVLAARLEEAEGEGAERGPDAADGLARRLDDARSEYEARLVRAARTDPVIAMRTE